MASPTIATRPAAALVKAVGMEAGFAIEDTADCFAARGPMKGIGERSVEVEATWASASSVVVVVAVAVVVDDAVVVIAAVGNGVVDRIEVDVANGKDGVEGTADVVVIVISIGASVSQGTSGWKGTVVSGVLGYN